MEEFSQQDLFNAILNYEKAGDAEKAQQVREILMREYPNSMNEIKVEQPVLTDEAQLAQAVAADEARTAENREVLAQSKHLGNIPIQAGLTSFSSGYMFTGEHLDEQIGAIHGEEAIEF